jgi:hypothetical protein
MDQDDEKLIKALEDETNAYLFDLTTDKMREQTRKLLAELKLPRKIERDYTKKLEYYKLVDDLTKIKYGAYVRWILLDDFSLANGAIFCDLVDADTIRCKNFTGRYFQLRTDECLVFQKLTNQEMVILSAMDHLSK